MAPDEHFGSIEAGPEFFTKASDVFARELFQPMYARANTQPDDVLQLIAEFRHKLDALDIVVATILGSHGEVSGPHPALQAALKRPIDPDRSDDGSPLSSSQELIENTDPFDDIGRNQRSRLRELTLLDYLSRDSRACSLQQVLNALKAKGFEDGSGVVVSQLHRLKKVGVIHQPAGGMYEITNSGLAHLHKLRSSFGSLLDESRD